MHTKTPTPMKQPTIKYHHIADTILQIQQKYLKANRTTNTDICCGTSHITSGKKQKQSPLKAKSWPHSNHWQKSTELPVGQNFTLSGYSKTARHTWPEDSVRHTTLAEVCEL